MKMMMKTFGMILMRMKNWVPSLNFQIKMMALKLQEGRKESVASRQKNLLTLLKPKKV